MPNGPGPQGLHGDCATLSWQYESSHVVHTGVWLDSDTTLWTKPGGELDLARGLRFADPAPEGGAPARRDHPVWGGSEGSRHFY